MSAIQSQMANCKNCYKCLRACPVKSIRFKNGQAEVQPEFCISCGICVDVCPQHAQTVQSKRELVAKWMKEQPVIVSLAPSFPGAFALDNPQRIVGALKALGFSQVRETAEGAAMVSDALAKLTQGKTHDNIITTCCPSVDALVEKHYPSLIHVLSPLISPMVAHARTIRKACGKDARIVFIGPCIAKIDEAEDLRNESIIDAVLTFAEIRTWFAESQIDPSKAEAMPFDGENPGLSRLYPIQGGILENLRARNVSGYRMLHVQGIPSCQALLHALEEERLHHCIIEMNACPGGCMGGPAMGNAHEARFQGILDVESHTEQCDERLPKIVPNISLSRVFLDRSHPQPLPTEEELRSILRMIGKEKPCDELNCASCGYPTCRAKATAVFQGKAELSMCMPYMYQAAQSMSGVVLDNTPNLIVVVDESLKICEINTSAQHIFKTSRTSALEQYLYEFMVTTDFEYVLETHETVMGKKIDLPAYGLTVMQTLVYLPRQHGVMGILRDVTAEEENAKKLYQLRVDTMDMAQKVITKQMVAAQEIASLLGETTAETKSTLTRLKTMIIGREEAKP